MIIVHQKKGEKWVQYFFSQFFFGSRNGWWASQSRFSIYFLTEYCPWFSSNSNKMITNFWGSLKSDNISSKTNFSVNFLRDCFRDKNPHIWDRIYFCFVFLWVVRMRNFSHPKNYTNYRSTTKRMEKSWQPNY